MKKINLIVFSLFLVLINGSCKDDILWQIKPPIDTRSMFNIGGNIYCWSRNIGYYIINKNGKIESKEIFSNNDERRKIRLIKTMPGVGTYACYNEDEKTTWLVELKDKGKFEKFANISDLDKNPSDYLISPDKKEYFLFIAIGGGFTTKDFPNFWRNAKTNEMTREVKYFNAGDVYFFSNKYLKLDESYYIFNDLGEEIKKIKWKETYLKNEKYISYGTIYGEDKSFYQLIIDMNKGISSEFYILKLDNELNLIGKRLVQTKGKYDGSCVLDFYVDKDGYIYTSSDEGKILTKFSPIKKGEDSSMKL